MTLRDIKIETLVWFKSKGLKPTRTRFLREVRDAVHYEMNFGGRGWGYSPTKNLLKTL